MNVDIFKLLGYGLLGLAAFFAIASVYLIEKLSKIAKPNKELLKIMRLFMILSLASLVVVGLFSIPGLSSSNEKLTERKELSDTSIYKMVGEILLLSSNYDSLVSIHQNLQNSYQLLVNNCDKKEIPPVVKPPYYFPLKIDSVSINELKKLNYTARVLSDENIKTIIREKVFIKAQ